MPPFQLAPDPHLFRRQVNTLNLVNEGQLCVFQAAGNTWPHLGSVAINSLLTTNHHGYLFFLCQALNSFGQDLAGSQGIGPAENAVTQQYGLVRSQRQSFPEGSFGTGRLDVCLWR